MRRALSILLSLVILVCPIATAETSLESIPAASGAQTHVIRVLLSRLGVTDRLDLTLDGVYSAGNKGENSMIFERGSELAIMLRDGSLIVYYEGMSFNAGSSFYFTRYQAQDGQENGIRLQNESNLYMGDLQLIAMDGVIQPILHIAVEDYLLGVVPYEMSEEFPLEALKAQAVTARTYAIRRMNDKKNYDVVDTTNDQVFRGYDKTKTNAAKAILETKGVCLFYEGKPAECFYTASNGGQTELSNNAWPGAVNCGYDAHTDDPYDIENPLSIVKTARIAKKGIKNDESTLALRIAIVDAMRDELIKKGFDTGVDSVVIDEITKIAPVNAAYDKDARVYAALEVTLHYSARKLLEASGDSEVEVSLFGADSATAAPELTPTPAPQYSAFEKVEDALTVALPYFPDLELALGLGINAGDNELVTVTEEGVAFKLESRRYGHGVGMSQRGAEWMAYQYHKSYDDILSFYYPSMTLMRFSEDGGALPALDQQALATAGPRPTPTPRPTLMPVSQTPPPSGWYALVTEIADDSSLNLRAAPDLASEIVMRLFKNQRLLVEERCTEPGWVKVRTDAAEGYVMEKFLTKE